MSEQICTFGSVQTFSAYGKVNGNLDVEFRERIVRCRNCSHVKPTTDDRRYCELWSHIVPDEGFCWRGEETGHAEA